MENVFLADLGVVSAFHGKELMASHGKGFPGFPGFPGFLDITLIVTPSFPGKHFLSDLNLPCLGFTS